LSCTSRRPTSNFCGRRRSITLFKEQRRYIRVETDANSTYHTPEKPKALSHIIATIDGVKVAGSTPLKGGRMRIILGAAAEPPVAPKAICASSCPVLAATLGDERGMKIIEAPKAEPRSGQLLPATVQSAACRRAR